MKKLSNPILNTVSKMFKINEKKTLKWLLKMSKLKKILLYFVLSH